MFHNLIESGSHTREIRRRGSFFIGTLAFYIALLTIAGVGSIYAYNIQLDEQQADMVTMLRFPPVTTLAAKPPERRAAAQPARTGGSRAQFVTRTEIVIQNPNLRNRQVARAGTPDVTAKMLPYLQLGTENSTPAHIGIPSDRKGDGEGGDGTGDGRTPRVLTPVDEDVPERIVKKEPPKTPPQQPRVVRVSQLLNGQAVSKPAPVYPKLAREARAQGTVSVQILVDEQGRVLSARATNGHPLLRQASEQSALQARFSPTVLNGQPVKVSGVITYNFVLQ